jgi:alcohol dehydrogenase
MQNSYLIPAINLLGCGCSAQIGKLAKDLGGTNILIVTDKVLVSVGLVGNIINVLEQNGIQYSIYDGVQPNPSTANVAAGLDLYQANGCDMLMAIGGGSPMDCSKAIGLVATNGGQISDYAGKDKLHRNLPPLIAVNTTAGTASEVTRFAVITDENSHIKMTIIDRRLTPSASVNDPELMVGMPKGITAATGMDALTHAIEAYVSIGATPVTDAVALKAIELISKNLPLAVTDGKNMTTRENMAYGEFMAGMAFNNASLGLVHAMAHQLGGFYNIPHGICNAILLPYVSLFNMPAKQQRYLEIGKTMGIATEGVPKRLAAKKTCQAMQQLGYNVGVPTNLKTLGAKIADLPILAANALKDYCIITNPVQPTHAEIMQIFTDAINGVKL